MPQQPNSLPYLQLNIRADGDKIIVTPQDETGERYKRYELSEPYGFRWFKEEFGGTLQEAAKDAKGQDLRTKAVEFGSLAYKAVFQESVSNTFDAAQRRNNENNTQRNTQRPLPIRLQIETEKLHEIPWEGMHLVSRFDFLGASNKVVTWRLVDKMPLPHKPCRVPRICVIAPVPNTVEMLVGEFRNQERASRMTLLEPISDKKALPRNLAKSLLDADGFHLLHLLAHGRVDEEGSEFKLTDDSRGPTRMYTEHIARMVDTAVRASNAGPLLLAYLDSCRGAVPAEDSRFGLESAAGTFIANGAVCTVAHLFPVEEGAARKLAIEFYKHLLNPKTGNGDVAKSLQHARMDLMRDGPYPGYGLSPVVYAYEDQTRIIELQTSDANAAAAVASKSPAVETGPGNAPPPSLPVAMVNTLATGFTLVVGDEGEAGRLSRDAFRNELVKALTLEIKGYNPSDESLSVLCQRFDAVRPKKLQGMLESFIVKETDEPPPLLKALVKHARVGMHISLLWVPVLEMALAKAHPSKKVIIIHPPDLRNTELGMQVVVSQWTEDKLEWIQMDIGTEEKSLPMDAFVVLRPYGGRIVTNTGFLATMRKEDDYLERFRNIENIFPDGLELAIRGQLAKRPLLFVGASALSWRHRGLFRILYENVYDKKEGPLTRCVAIMEPPISELEKRFWNKTDAFFPGFGLALLHVPEPNKSGEAWAQSLAECIESLRVSTEVQP